jgi:hypothetical protein
LLAAEDRLNPLEAGDEPLHVNSLKALRAEMDDFGIEFEIRLLPRAELPEQPAVYTSQKAVALPKFGELYPNRHQPTDFTLLPASAERFVQDWKKARPLE